MKAKILSLICALLMALGLQAQNAEFETATGARGQGARGQRCQGTGTWHQEKALEEKGKMNRFKAL